MGIEADITAADRRLAARLKQLRQDRGWSLAALAERSGVSRATLSRLELCEVSPTASVLGRLSAAYGLSTSRLLAMAEAAHAPLVRQADQAIWRDPETGFERRIVSPPGEALAGEAVRCRLPAGARIAYAEPPRPGLEHHLVLLAGGLTVSLDDAAHALSAGDCLRYRLFGASAFEATGGGAAEYLLFLT